jgi:hypothetical protein
MNPDIKAAQTSRDEAFQAYSNLRQSRNELVQPVLDAKAELDEAMRLRDQLFEWKEDWNCEIDGLVLEFSQNRLFGYDNSLDLAIEKLLERHAAVKKAEAEYSKKEEAYVESLTQPGH